MLCKEIYEAALSVIAEQLYLEDTSDYEERAPYLMCAIYHEMSAVDNRYRKAMGLDNTPIIEGVMLPLSAEFPLSDRLSAPAIFYLASSLIMDENSDMSDKLFERYCDSISSIYSEIPSTVEKIPDVYN